MYLPKQGMGEGRRREERESGANRRRFALHIFRGIVSVSCREGKKGGNCQTGCSVRDNKTGRFKIPLYISFSLSISLSSSRISVLKFVSLSCVANLLPFFPSRNFWDILHSARAALHEPARRGKIICLSSGTFLRWKRLVNLAADRAYISRGRVRGFMNTEVFAERVPDTRKSRVDNSTRVSPLKKKRKKKLRALASMHRVYQKNLAFYRIKKILKKNSPALLSFNIKECRAHF